MRSTASELLHVVVRTGDAGVAARCGALPVGHSRDLWLTMSLSKGFDFAKGALLVMLNSLYSD